MWDTKRLDQGSYKFWLNDVEAFTFWAAKKQDTPSISISYQTTFCHEFRDKQYALLMS